MMPVVSLLTVQPPRATAPDGEEYMLATDAAKAFGKSMHEVFGM